MFTELMPLLRIRPFTITVVPVGDQCIRVNVIPQAAEKDKKANQQIGHSHSKEVAPIPEKAIKGLTTPLCLTGTPAEIDATLVPTLNNFTALHLSLQESFDKAAAAIGASVKAIEERERLKKEADKANKKSTTTAKSETKKQAPPESGLPSLFTTGGQSTPAAVSANDNANRPAITTTQSESNESPDNDEGEGEED